MAHRTISVLVAMVFPVRQIAYFDSRPDEGVVTAVAKCRHIVVGTRRGERIRLKRGSRMCMVATPVDSRTKATRLRQEEKEQTHYMTEKQTYTNTSKERTSTHSSRRSLSQVSTGHSCGLDADLGTTDGNDREQVVQ
jgi:transposase InsO family protein